MKKRITGILALIMAVLMMTVMFPQTVLSLADSTVKADFDEKFPDGPGKSHYAYSEIKDFYDGGVIGGFEDGLLRLQGYMTRAQLWQMLYNCAIYAGEDVAVPDDHKVTCIDYVPDTWYSDALRWADANGILCLSDINTAEPSAVLQTWQLYTEVVRFSEYMGIELEPIRDIGTITEFKGVPTWAHKYFYTIINAGIINVPNGSVISTSIHRQSAMVVLHRAVSRAITFEFIDTVAKPIPVDGDGITLRVNSGDALVYGESGELPIFGCVITDAEQGAYGVSIVIKNDKWTESAVIYEEREIEDDGGCFFAFGIPFGTVTEAADGTELDLTGAPSTWTVYVVATDEDGRSAVSGDITVTVNTDGALIKDFEYTVDEDGTATVTGYTGTATKVVIPDVIDGALVVGISNGAFSDDSITELSLPYNTSFIGDAFASLSNLPLLVYRGSECEYCCIDIHDRLADINHEVTEEHPEHYYTEEVETVLEPSIILEGINARYCIFCYDLKDVEYVPVIDIVLPFTDVAKGSWYRKAVEFVVDEGLFNGMSKTTFCPNVDMTRAMLVTVLYRLEGSPEVDGEVDFSDVKSGSYYEDAVLWASQNGIVNGVGGGRFAPDKNITREELATILYRYAGFIGLSTDSSFKLYPYFCDGNLVSSWAQDALEWAKGVGIVGGVVISDIRYIQPKNNATRAQVATMLSRFVLLRDYGVVL